MPRRYHQSENYNLTDRTMPKERNKADSYREKAYEGNTKAMNNLGVCYERGTGVKVNLEMAFDWYMKAAEQGKLTNTIMKVLLLNGSANKKSGRA